VASIAKEIATEDGELILAIAECPTLPRESIRRLNFKRIIRSYVLRDCREPLKRE
jgi:hypothetical protein